MRMLNRSLVRIALLCCVGWYSVSARAFDLAKSFPKGKGSRFELKLDGGMKTDVMIYVADSTKSAAAIEMYLSSAAMGMPLELWLLSRFGAKSEKKIELQDMFAWMKGSPAPEKIPAETVGRSKGLQLTDFMLRDAAALGALRVEKGPIQVPAGTVQATHYRMKQNKNTIDFWISEEAAPLGLVKIDSTGENAFSMALVTLLSNVQAKIDPRRAVPMTATTQSLFQATGLSKLIP